jgi:replicative DNA helicase Mcm
VWKQIGLPKDLLDRFDLIFPIHSSKEEKEQRKVAHLIVNKYDTNSELTKRKYSNEFIMKFVSYARNNFNPIIPKDVENYLVDNFINIVKPADPNEDSAYFSYRILTNIVRLTQAAAKMRLSNEANIDDAKIAIDILLKSLKAQDIITPEGLFDYERAESITPKKKRDLKYQLIEIVRVIQKTSEDGLANFDEIRSRAIQEGVDEAKFEEMIDKLSREGEVIEPKRLKFKVM